ncbi:MAG: ATP-binding protein [Acidimicrobiales bacterium]
MPARSLRLAPEPSAAGKARQWAAAALGGWPESAVETVQLLLSEVVTNAVLHAATTVDLRLVPERGGVRLEVADGAAAAPILKHYGPDADTGRGLHLLTHLADGWGVLRSQDGKVVWFVVGAAAGGAAAGGAAAARGEAGGGGHDAAADGGVPPVRPGLVEIHIHGLPVAVYLEAEQHNDAVMREFALIVESSGRDAERHQVPRRLLRLADELRTTFSTATTGLRAQVERAVERGETSVDLVLAVPTTGWEMLLHMADRFDEADSYCEAGALLTLASSPTLRRFRRWYARQVIAQLAGGPPASWPG